MGNALCLPKDKTASGDATNNLPDDYEPFNKAAYEAEGEEKVERRGSIFPQSPSVASRTSLGIIPPYETSGQASPNGRGSVVSSGSSTGPGRRSARMFSSTSSTSELNSGKKTKDAKEVRILLLGSGESGKSTIIKQMKIIHQNGYSKEELLAFRPAIFKNIEQALQQVITAVEVLQLESILDKCEKYLDYIKELDTDYEVVTELPQQLVEAVNFVWLEAGVFPIYDKLCHASYIYESAS